MKKINTEWNLGLLYKSEKDPKIERDLKSLEKGYANFEKKYKGKDFTSTPEKLAKALKDHEALLDSTSYSEPWWYFALRQDMNSLDEIAKANATKNDQRLVKSHNKIEFFKLEIGKIQKKDQKKYLESKVLAPYKYFLVRVFNNAQYYLTEKEEQLFSLLSQTSYDMWIDASEKLISLQTIEYQGKKMPLPEVIGIYANLPKKDRRYLHNEINQKLKSISDSGEAEINAVYNFKKVIDETRKYKKPYSSTVLAHENDEESVEILVNLVTKSFRISHKFFRLHAKLLKEKKIKLADRSAKIGEIKRKFDFETAVKIVSDSFAKVDPKYSKILSEFIENNQIDVYPRKGKRGGAYCWGSGKLPTFVLLNHTDNIRSVETLAHEMGHAIHTELSKNLTPYYRHYTTATAEVASTFFEQIVVDDLERHLSDKEKIILLHNKILGDIATIFRQIAFFNFEKELHQQIREKGQLSSLEISKLLSKHLRSYLGPNVEVTDEDGYFFMYISHIRRFFYVYSYAYGQIVSRALYENWKKDSKFASKVEQFLRAGRSMSPKDIFKSVGIDTSNPEFFKAGLKGIERDIDRLAKLTGHKI